MEACFPGDGLPMGSGELVHYLALLVCTAFPLHLKLSLTQPVNFLTFTLVIFSTVLPRDSERVAPGGSAVYWGLTTTVFLEQAKGLSLISGVSVLWA